MKNKTRKLVCICLIICIASISLAGCGGDDKENVKQINSNEELEEKKEEVSEENKEEKVEENNPVETEEVEHPENNESQSNEETSETESTTTLQEEDDETLELTDIQKNSVSMLNYLVVLTQEINASKNSRLYVEKIYDSVLNNTYPNVVDKRTQIELSDLLEILNEYRMTAIKRERLQYIYEQNCAYALRAAIPDPRGLLSAVSSMNIGSIVSSVAYMAMDSYTSYTTYTADLNLEYLQDGWELDDDESEYLHNSRTATFNYLIDMVRKYEIPGDLTLNEKKVDEYVEWKNTENVVSRIQSLESHQADYKAFGGYWLTLAESYFQNNEFEKCLEALEEYEKIDTRIFRKDYELAQVLPFAISSASGLLEKNEIETREYVNKTEHYLDLLEANSDQTDWELRYIGAQTYVDLYSKTGDNRYLESAYDITINTVNSLLKEQQNQNSTYMKDVVKKEVPKGTKEEEVKEIENYNKQLEETRKTELPPIYEPLLINCELLFALAEKLDISDAEKNKIDEILHMDNEPLFLVEPVDNLFRFSNKQEKDENDINVKMTAKDFSIPANYVSATSVITGKSFSGDEEYIFDDFSVSDVERKKKSDINRHIVTYYSKSMDEHKFKKDETIEITVKPLEEGVAGEYTFKFIADREMNMGDFWNTHAVISRVTE